MALDWRFQIMAWVFAFCTSGCMSQTVDFTADKTMPVTEGDMVRFTCTATSTTTNVPSLIQLTQTSSTENSIVSWRIIDGKCIIWSPIEEDDKSIYNSTCNWSLSTIYLDIFNVTADFHDVNVTCKVFFGTDAFDGVDGFVTLKVNVPLQGVYISENAITLQEDRNINVSCSARSRPLPEITWFISGRQLHDNLTSVTYNDIEVNSTIHYTGNRTDNRGMLYCRTSNTITESQSSNVPLNITYPPDISVVPHGLPIEGTEEYNASCLILDSNPDVSSFTWNIGSETTDPTNDVLTLRNLNRTDTNNYTCTAANGIGQPSSSTLFIDVLYKGTILSISYTNLSLNEGDIFVADVSAEGKPLPNITWTYDRTNTILLTDHETETSALNLTRRCEDTGNYTCTVDNGLLYPDIGHFRIMISCKPRTEPYTDSENKVEISVGGTLTLEATFVGFPQPTISWYFRPNNLTTSSIVSSNHYVTNSDEAMHVTTLSILQVNSTHNGQFIVTAENTLGQESRVFTVNVVDSDENSGINVEAIVGGVAGAVIFLVIVALVCNCYRKKKRKEKQRNRSWRSSPKDIDDIIRENPIEEEPTVEPMYSSGPGDVTSSKQTKIEEPQQRSNIYAKVVRSSVKQSNELEIKLADNDANTKF